MRETYTRIATCRVAPRCPGQEPPGRANTGDRRAVSERERQTFSRRGAPGRRPRRRRSTIHHTAAPASSAMRTVGARRDPACTEHRPSARRCQELAGAGKAAPNRGLGGPGLRPGIGETTTSQPGMVESTDCPMPVVRAPPRGAIDGSGRAAVGNWLALPWPGRSALGSRGRVLGSRGQTGYTERLNRQRPASVRPRAPIDASWRAQSDHGPRDRARLRNSSARRADSHAQHRDRDRWIACSVSSPGRCKLAAIRDLLSVR